MTTTQLMKLLQQCPADSEVTIDGALAYGIDVVDDRYEQHVDIMSIDYDGLLRPDNS